MAVVVVVVGVVAVAAGPCAWVVPWAASLALPCLAFACAAGLGRAGLEQEPWD